MKMIYDAAEELTHTCITGGGRTEGGIATGIGMFGNTTAMPWTHSCTRGAWEVEC